MKPRFGVSDEEDERWLKYIEAEDDDSLSIKDKLKNYMAFIRLEERLRIFFKYLFVFMIGLALGYAWCLYHYTR